MKETILLWLCNVTICLIDNFREDKSFISERIFIYSLRNNVDELGNPLNTTLFNKTSKTNATG
jgi:hypothetical protein